MRKDWRNVLSLLVLFLLGTTAGAAPRPGEKETSAGSSAEVVRMTLEVNWSAATTQEPPVDGFVLELSSGRVLEALEWPPEGGEQRLLSAARNGAVKLGRRREGKVRARIEAPLDASLVLRGGEQRVSVPLVAVLERRQQTPPQANVTLTVERLPWDALTVEVGGPGSDGLFANGDPIPVVVGYNILHPDTAEVAVSTTAILSGPRGTAEVWRNEHREVLPSNRAQPPARSLSMPAPGEEGVYVLEIQATWEPVVSKESSRLSRLIRRRKTVVANSAVRRVSFVVLGPGKPAAVRSEPNRETDVDSIDFSRARSHRPLASGRSRTAVPGRNAWAVPAEALIEPSARDKLRGWFSRTGGEASQLDAADDRGLAWSAVGLRVPHPGKPHRLTLTIRGGEPAELGVAVVEPSDKEKGGGTHVLLDASASGPPILQEGPHASFSWLIWPQSSESVLILVNRNLEAMVRLGTVTLTELDDLPADPPVVEPVAGAKRTVGLYLTGLRALEPFGGDSSTRGYLTAARNLGRYLSYCGATAVVLPERIGDGGFRRCLDGQGEEDATGPDPFDVLEATLRRSGCQLWRELDLSGSQALPGLPPADSAEAIGRGLGRVDRLGNVEGAVYHPLHPEVREAMKRRLLNALPKTSLTTNAVKKDAANRGLLVRLGSGPTLLGAPDSGLDDITFGRFVRETFSADSAREIPGQDPADPERFAVRSRYVSGVGRTPWLTWRSSAIAELYRELTEAVETASPGTTLALVTPTLSGGPVDAEARRVDLSGLAPSQAWRSVGLDLQEWPKGPRAPLILRGATLSTDALAHDLATSTDLDAIVAARPRRGTLLMLDEATPASVGTAPDAAGVKAEVASVESRTGGQEPDSKSGLLSGLRFSARGVTPRSETVWLTALPLGDGPAADEPLGHAIAAIDSQCVILAAKAVAGHEPRIRQFAQVLRALPAWQTAAVEVEGNAQTRPFGVALRTMSEPSETYFEIANDSPYPLKLSGKLEAAGGASVHDLGLNMAMAATTLPDGPSLTIDLLPYGVSAIRVSGSGGRLTTLTPQPSQAVLTTMQARFNELTVQLARLNRGLSSEAVEPSNSGFEPADTNARPPAAAIDLPEHSDDAAVRAPVKPAGHDPHVLPGGWSAEPSGDVDEKAEIDTQGARVGLGSLRIKAGQKPFSVVSEPFMPATQSALTLEAYFRSAGPDVKVRVWIEGQVAGQPYVRRSELSVSSQWESRAFRASDVPSGGLESARIRFEVISPGTVWIDDLHVIGDSASKSARLNTQRALLAAIQAYRDARYADFARLAASHWVRQTTTPATRLARGVDRRKRIDTSSSVESSASALSQDSKLR